MFDERLTESNFLLYAAKHYDNIQCCDTEEFYDDLKRFNHLKRLLGRYEEKGELRERLIINHLVILFNVFNDHATRMMCLKLYDHLESLKPFLVLMNRMPDRIYNVGEHDIIYSSDIKMDQKIVDVLRKI